MLASHQWYAEVAPCVPLPATGPQTYTYQVPSTVSPDNLLSTAVRIPLGRRQVRGVVIRVHQERVPYPTKMLEPASAWQLTAYQIVFARWLHDTMRGGLGYTLRLFFPPGARTPRTGAPSPLSPAAAPAPAKREALMYGAGDVAVIEADEGARVQAIAEHITKSLGRSQQALVIVPERWMIDRLGTQLAKHLPGNQIMAYDASLAAAPATKIWHTVQQGQVAVVIGTQKALFLPWSGLGTIIVYEEAYRTHKLWDQYPRLDNRIGAGALANIHGLPMTYISSFPSLGLYNAIQHGSIHAAMYRPTIPTITFFPLTVHDRQQHRLLPDEFIAKIKQWLKNKEKIVLLHTTRGAWRTLLCRACHRAVPCPTCGVSAVVHERGRKPTLVCHHCDTVAPLPAKCPRCRKGPLTPMGAGSEKIAEILGAIFPRVAIQQIEAGSEKLLSRKTRKKGEIIVGTSAIFTRLAGRSCDRAVYLFPERAMQYPDFRSEERVIATLVRLAQLVNGRAGVAVVTAKKDLTLPLRLTAKLPVYERLLRERKQLGYPPYQDTVLLTVTGTTAARAKSKATTIRHKLEAKNMPISIRGPFASFQKMRRGNFEQHILLLGSLSELRAAYADQPVSIVDVFPERIL